MTVASWAAGAGRCVAVGSWRWLWGHRRMTVWLGVVGVAAAVTGFVLAERAVVAVLAVASVASGTWAGLWPVSYERLVGGPARRRRWRRWARRSWPGLARLCGLGVVESQRRRDRGGRPVVDSIVTVPRLVKVTTSGSVLTLLVRARVGQTVDDVEGAAAKIRDAAAAQSVRVTDAGPGRVRFTLIMQSWLLTPRAATAIPTDVVTDVVPVGRREDGAPWELQVRGLHTLFVGCSGAGKGSPMWGITAALAPASAAGQVRLWGMDLKRGMEVLMGAGLWTATATTPEQALVMLRRLVTILDERGDRLAGNVRTHEPSVGDPLDVLVVDELAALVAYLTDRKMRDEALALLSRVLQQGRALGVLVLGFVQDPKKETIPFRDAFTQTVALRLRSREAVTMVLGDGLAAIAPAHKIPPDAQGTAYVVGEDGRPVKVRADYWPDPLIRAVAASYRPLHHETLSGDVQDTPGDVQDTVQSDVPAGSTAAGSSSAGRKPRSPRAARAHRSGAAGSGAAPVREG